MNTDGIIDYAIMQKRKIIVIEMVRITVKRERAIDWFSYTDT